MSKGMPCPVRGSVKWVVLGDHGLLYKGCRFYEGLVRVPLIFAWPGSIQPDVRSSALVELIDLSATLLELAGVALPESMQGRSLLPILLGQAAPDTHRDFVRCEYFDALAPDFISGSLSYATMYRNRCHKLCMYHSHGLGELYDLELDPWEHNNLWDSARHRATRDELVRASFDATMMHSIDLGSERIAPM